MSETFKPEFVFEPEGVVKEREAEMWEATDDFMRDQINVEVKTDIDGREYVARLSLEEIHVLEQLAMRMITDPEVFATLPFSFYRKVVKFWFKRAWANVKGRF